RAGFALLIAAASALAAQAQTSIDPAVLSGADVQRYRKIFADERAGKFDKAKELMAEVSDTSLKGYALAEHYLSSHSKKVPVSELISWLQEYRELPVAERIYRLAVKRSTKKVRRHHHTILVAVVTNIPVPAGMPRLRGGGYEDVNLADPPISSPQARAALEQINLDVRADAPDSAYAVLQPLIDANAVPAYDLARLSQRVAQSYFTEGMDDKAYALADRMAETGRQSAPLLDWNAGLAAFRLGHYDDAARHFEILAQVGSVPNWVRSGAAFWAARAHMRLGEPSRVVALLTAAAREEPTFYGLLAEQLLDVDTQSGFTEPVLDQSSLERLMQSASAHRAVALWQSGERTYVEHEMERAFGESDPKLDPAFAALARKLGAPNLELRASETSASRGIILTGLFPVPQYEPAGGYTIDPSLVLAITRAESRFHAEAVSGAGARGLMQVMPGTAVYLGGPGAAAHLNDPRYNLALGQRLVAQLLNLYNGNLVELCAAYNIGALKVSNWMAVREGKGDDALLFIESMHAPETRLYVKRVLTYHWMYRRRLGLDAATLKETAAGDWPTYTPPAQTAPPPPPSTSPEESDAPPTAP
ncbi:MAG: lytic transglycosylase domain-containing protein, partial [Alphaproteobacteria bacterium]|nr:lytic transglycosylase domain-containing protein [Alphaproteobacteria bacterium]